MDLNKRIKLLEQLGVYILSNHQDWVDAKANASYNNPWFTPVFIDTAVLNIANQFLQPTLLSNWVKHYQIKLDIIPKNVGIVMAGNIPLVGFHDFLCAFVCGHQLTIKLSSKDSVLLTHLVNKLMEWEEEIATIIHFEEQLKGCDAYIATGSNNSSRYFDYYFNKYPSIIRRNRTSVAVLSSDETEEELHQLSDDIQMYFGLGCRNVTKLYVPPNYNFLPLLDALKKYEYYFELHKYKNNYDYQLALLMMGKKFYMTNSSIILTEEKSIFSPISQVNYEYYYNKENLINQLLREESIQCIVGKGFINFGNAQTPSLFDYADGIDTMQFLCTLS